MKLNLIPEHFLTSEIKHFYSNMNFSVFAAVGLEKFEES